jgi:hypothetical protein
MRKNRVIFAYVLIICTRVIYYIFIVLIQE